MPDPGSPSWMDAAFVQETLRRGGEEDAVVKSVTLKTLGEGGDHYASAMFRVTAETTSGPRSLIAKVPPPGAAMKELVRDTGLFRVEALMLSDIVPKMQKLLDAAAPGKFPPFAAKCPYYGQQPEDFLVLEDLAPEGFVLADRHRGLGLRHSLLALRTLGRFHAASTVLLSQDPDIREQLGNPFDTSNESFELFVYNAFKMAATVTRTWSDFPQEISEALDTSKKSAFEKLKKINEFKPGRFNVIQHGDFWLNNMMFRYEDDKITGFRFVDLQIAHTTTPAVDILYFLNTSISEDVSKNHRDLLIREYYASLSETMTLLGATPPTFSELLNDLEEFGFYSLFGSVCVLPIVKATEVPDLDKSLKKDDTEQENIFMYASPVFERWMRRLLPEIHSKGLLSCKEE